MNYRFNDEAVDNVFKDLVTLDGVTRAFISAPAIKKVKELLNLEACSDSEELRAIRNSVVKTFGNGCKACRTKIEEHPESAIAVKQNWATFDLYMKLMSAITSVIDQVMLEKFHTL